MSGRPPGIPEHFSIGEDQHRLTLTYDEVLVLFEFFERLEETDAISFAHPAEWTALGHIMHQLTSIPWEVFDPRYRELLAGARTRLSQGFEGNVPGLGYVAVRPDGRVESIQNPDVDAASANGAG